MVLDCTSAVRQGRYCLPLLDAARLRCTVWCMYGSRVDMLRDLTYRGVAHVMDLAAKRPGGSFMCPVCSHRGRFATAVASTGVRRHARCPRCGALERHRLQTWVVREKLLPLLPPSPRVLHFAPEESIVGLLRPVAGTYTTADYALPGMDLRLDLRATGLPPASYDLVYASHVLEHVDRDLDALAEIRRILAPGGIAVLPVPLVGTQTVEYPAPNPLEAYHVRAPGYDYYDRYDQFFSSVERLSSHDAPAAAQTFVYEDRSNWPTRSMPHRAPSPGERHTDVVPLCRA